MGRHERLTRASNRSVPLGGKGRNVATDAILRHLVHYLNDSDSYDFSLYSSYMANTTPLGLISQLLDNDRNSYNSRGWLSSYACRDFVYLLYLEFVQEKREGDELEATSVTSV